MYDSFCSLYEERVDIYFFRQIFICSSTVSWTDFFSPIAIFVKNHLEWVYFWVLCSVLLICVSIFLPVSYSSDYCSCIMSWSWIVLILQMCSSLSMLCWLFWGFWFLCKLLNQFINIYKITSWNFGWDCIEDQLGKNWHLANTESFYLWM